MVDRRTAKIAFDLDQLLAFYDFPGRALGASENYQSGESTFATVRNRSKITKGRVRAAGIAMAYKLIEAAQSCLRAVNAPTWSPSSAPEPNSRTANPSNDPTNQEVQIRLLKLTELQARAADPDQAALTGAPTAPVDMGSTPDDKIRFYTDLFRCRTDVYAVRWENKRRPIGLDACHTGLLAQGNEAGRRALLAAHS